MFTYPIVYVPMTPGSGAGGGSYVLPTASASELGGVKAKTKTKEAVIDANSGLWVSFLRRFSPIRARRTPSPNGYRIVCGRRENAV